GAIRQKAGSRQQEGEITMRGAKSLKFTTLGAVLALALSAASVSAATFKWANDGDVNSMDPYARNETFLLTFLQNIYEPLVRRSKDLKVEPALATEWAQTAPDVWRFKLRQGVKFSDGTPFTADDVLFSFKRIREPTSALNSNVATVADLVKVDDFTVDFHTKGPD